MVDHGGSVASANDIPMLHLGGVWGMGYWAHRNTPYRLSRTYMGYRVWV